jgi:hypothetical protein
MQVNRCIRCGPGTFSLHPNISCQPCITPGGSCTDGLLLPADGYYMPSPFVPQLLRCPLTGACAGHVLQGATDQQMQSILLAFVNGTSHRPHLQRMLQASNRTARQEGVESKSEVERSEALLWYSRLLGNALMQEPTDGPPLLLDVPYQAILDEFQSLQCATG